MDIRKRLDYYTCQLINEWPVRNKSFQDLISKLRRTKMIILERAQKSEDSEFNRRVLSHIIGIERWGQSRLRVFLGEPLVMDEYNGYRPTKETSWPLLVQGFAATRDETIQLAEQLAARPLAVTKVPHNQFGETTAKGWLQYLSAHASRERYQIR